MISEVKQKRFFRSGLLVFLLAIICAVCLVGLSSAIGTYPAVDPNMVLYYHMNETDHNSTTINDSSGNNNYGILNNTEFQSGTGILEDGSFYFNGVNSSINISNGGLIPSNGTISFWFLANSSTTGYMFSSNKNSRFSIEYVNTNSVLLQLGNPLISLQSSVSSAPLNTYNFVTFVYQEINATATYGIFYLNGNLIGSSNFSTISPSSRIYLGMFNGGGTYFNGSIDELIISNVTKTPDEVWGIYRNYVGVINQENKGYYRFISGSPLFNGSNVYLNSTGIVSTVFKDNVTIDCLGSLIEGNGSQYLFYLKYGSVVKNCRFKNYQGVLNLISVNSSDIYNNTFENISTLYAIRMTNSGSTVHNNLFNYSNSLITFENVTYLNFYSNNIRFYENISYSNIWFNAPYSYKNNITFYENNFSNIPYGSSIFFSYGNYNSLNISKNRFFNSTLDDTHSGAFLKLLGMDGDISIIENYFNLSSTMVLFSAPVTGTNNYTANTLVKDNILDDISGNGDSYNVGFHVNNAGNINFTNNTLTRVGCVAFLLQGFFNVRVENNSATFDLQSNIDKMTNCAYEPISFISAGGLWKTWTSNSPRPADQINSTYLNQYYPSINLTMLGNEINEFPLLIQISSYSNFINDITNNWKETLSFENSLQPTTEYYVSNDIDNLFTTYSMWSNEPVIYSTWLGEGSGGSTTSIRVKGKIYKDYLYFENVNLTETYNVSIFDKTNFLAFNTNGSIYGNTDISLNDGNLNITLPAKNSSCVFDNANVTEGISRGSGSCVFPLTITRSTTFSRTVNNDLPEDLEGNTVIFTVSNCNGLGVINSDSQTWNNGEYQCSGNQLTLTDVTLDSGDTDFDFNYGCSAFEQTGYLLIQIAGALLVLAGSIFFLWKTGIWEQMTVGQLVITFIIIVVAISLFLASVDIIAQRCAV